MGSNWFSNRQLRWRVRRRLGDISRLGTPDAPWSLGQYLLALWHRWLLIVAGGLPATLDLASMFTPMRFDPPRWVVWGGLVFAVHLAAFLAYHDLQKDRYEVQTAYGRLLERRRTREQIHRALIALDDTRSLLRQMFKENETDGLAGLVEELHDDLCSCCLHVEAAKLGIESGLESVAPEDIHTLAGDDLIDFEATLACLDEIRIDLVALKLAYEKADIDLR